MYISITECVWGLFLALFWYWLNINWDATRWLPFIENSSYRILNLLNYWCRCTFHFRSWGLVFLGASGSSTPPPKFLHCLGLCRGVMHWARGCAAPSIHRSAVSAAPGSWFKMQGLFPWFPLLSKGGWVLLWLSPGSKSPTSPPTHSHSESLGTAEGWLQAFRCEKQWSWMWVLVLLLVSCVILSS